MLVESGLLNELESHAFSPQARQCAFMLTRRSHIVCTCRSHFIVECWHIRCVNSISPWVNFTPLLCAIMWKSLTISNFWIPKKTWSWVWVLLVKCTYFLINIKFFFKIFYFLINIFITIYKISCIYIVLITVQDRYQIW